MSASIESLELALGQRDKRFGAEYDFDFTCPVVANGKVLDNGCPYEYNDDYGLSYEWSPEHQAAFEATLLPIIDLHRWDGIAAQLRSHWQNGSSTWSIDGIPWLESFAPGGQPILHELGKTPPFRKLRFYRPNERDISAQSSPVTLNDHRLRFSNPVPSMNRAPLIASRGMLEWYSARFIDIPWAQQVCVICNDSFWPNLLDSNAIMNIGLPRYCSPCIKVMRRDVWDRAAPIAEKHHFVGALQEMFECTGIVPDQGVKKTAIAGLTDDERDLWARLLMSLPGPSSAKAMFGSWAGYLHEAGLLEQKGRKGQGGYVSVAACGHVALSLGERTVCEWLFAHDIDHEKEPHYPNHVLNPNGRLRCDWLINDCWVELAGRMSDPKYASTMANKQKIAADLGLRLLVLLPAELRNLDALADEYWS